VNEIHSKLKQLIAPMQSLSENEWDQFTRIWQPFEAKRKEILTTAGEKERHLYFVAEGVQRIFYIDDQSREATLVFTYQPSFGGVLDAFLTQTPSRYYYETLTPSCFLRTTFLEFESTMTSIPNVEKMVRKGLAQTVAGVLERLVELQCYSAEDRFKKLLQRSPHILQLIPHRYLANYIGIDPTNFSKLMNRVRI
jgi:CRP-like cAMP-binding protein